MRPPSASAMLGAWERGLDQGPVERALTLLALGCPESTSEGLAELSIGERDRRLLALREAMFGPRLTGLITCAACGESLELDFAASELCAAPKPDEAGSVLLRRCVVSARCHGEPVAAQDLPPAVVAAAARRLSEADPQVDMRFALACAGC